MKTEKLNSADFIVPLSINGLNGRSMHIKSTKKTRKREILLVYGHHSSLERMFSIAQNLSEYGTVSMPDLPGFGGMDSFYILGEKPTLDNMADYLATYIRLHYKKKPITICAMSWGFLVTTKMLQKYPEVAKQVNLLIGFVGFSSVDDFKIAPNKQLVARATAKFYSGAITSAFFRYVLLQPAIIKGFYRAAASRHPKMKDADADELTKRVNFEVVLWQSNDARTYMFTNGIMFNLDLTHQKVALPVVHVGVDSDQYFDNKKVVKNLHKIYSDVIVAKAKLANHAPTIIDDVKEAGAIIPPSVRRMLARKPKTASSKE
jgi:pimeloyl-ACP methyl ester carboxylesterase